MQIYPTEGRQFSKAMSLGWQLAPYNYLLSLLNAFIVVAVTNLLLSVI
jgi:hypothetical protein